MKTCAIWNAAVLAALKAGAPLLSLLVVLAVSRKLGAAGLGRYGLSYACLAFFSLLGPLGLPALLTREGARDPAALGPLLSSGLALTGVISIILTAAMAFGGRVFGPDLATARAVAVLSLAVAPSTWLCCFEAAFLALQDTGPIAIAAAAEHAIKVGLALPALFAGRGLEAVLGAAVAARFAACGISIFLLSRRGIRLSFPEKFASIRALGSQTPVFALSSICATLYWRIDVFLLSYFRGVAETGYYTAAYRLLDLANLLPQSLCQALYPQLAGEGTIHPRRRSATLLWLVALAAPAALAVTALARPLLGRLYGANFTIAAPTLTILIWTVLPYAWNRYHACLLVATGQQRADLGINAAMLALNVAFNLWLIPRYGAGGAAVVTLTTALALGAAQWAYLKRLPAAAGRPVAVMARSAAAALRCLCLPLFIILAATSYAQSRPTINAVVSAADFQPGVAFEGLASVFGSGFSDQEFVAASIPLPAQLGQTQVRYCAPLSAVWDDCVPMQLIYVGPTQINLFLSYGSRDESQATFGALVVRRNDTLSDETRRQAFVPVAPRIFAMGFDCNFDPAQADPSPCGLVPQRTSAHQTIRGALTDSGGRLVTSNNPARVGRFYSLWLTGLGRIANAGTLFPVQMSLGSIPVSGSSGATSMAVTALFAGQSPQFSGLDQINFQLPQNLMDGPATGGAAPLHPCADYRMELTLSLAEGGDNAANTIQIPVLIRNGDVACAN